MVGLNRSAGWRLNMAYRIWLGQLWLWEAIAKRWRCGTGHGRAAGSMGRLLSPAHAVGLQEGAR